MNIDARRLKVCFEHRCILQFDDGWQDGKPEKLIINNSFELINGCNQKVITRPSKLDSVFCWAAYEITKMLNDTSHKLRFRNEKIYTDWLDDYYRNQMECMYFDEMYESYENGFDFFGGGDVDELIKYSFISFNQSCDDEGDLF